MRHEVNAEWQGALRAHAAKVDQARLETRSRPVAAPKGRQVILWLSASLAGSVAANILQGLLYVALLKRIC